MNCHEPGLTKWHENQRDMNVPPICLAIGVVIAGTRITCISAIDGVF